MLCPRQPTFKGTVVAKKKSDAECTLLRAVRKMLAQREESYLDIYSATGLHPSWIEKIKRGRVTDPSVNRIQRLYEHLTQQKLTHL
jgi:predicted urease superfamily metal-dependent hydrolase